MAFDKTAFFVEDLYDFPLELLDDLGIEDDEDIGDYYDINPDDDEFDPEADFDPEAEEATVDDLGTEDYVSADEQVFNWCIKQDSNLDGTDFVEITSKADGTKKKWNLDLEHNLVRPWIDLPIDEETGDYVVDAEQSDELISGLPYQE